MQRSRLLHQAHDVAVRVAEQGDGHARPHLEAFPEGRGALTFYVHVENLEATLAQVERAGGTTVRERLQVGPNVSIALFGDPDGNVVGLMEEA